MRSRQSPFVLLSCALAIAHAACGGDGQPASGLEEHVPADDAGTQHLLDAAHLQHIDGAVDPSGDGGDSLAQYANWHLPAPGACGELPLSFASDTVQATKPDWSEGAKVPLTGLPNRYGYAGQTLTDYVRNGQTHMVSYPVDVTASWLPLNIITKALNDPLSQLFPAGNPLVEYGTLDNFEKWIGLSEYPDCDGGGARSIPFPNGQRPDYRMGSTRVQLADGPALTYSCAGCHAERLFGRSILGLQNRAAHANVAIDKARKTLQGLPVGLVQFYFGASEGDARILTRLQAGLAAVDIRAPLVRGLDTSLVQVALSLDKRAKDAYATIDTNIEANPRPDRLDTIPADSKPGNWWVLKYKNRWLLDGSVVSGNPIYTNILWNEIGRGTDLKQLQGWLDANQKTIDELTAAAFAAEPVRWTEFFPAETLDLDAAKRGKALFDGACASCHGSYLKGWELPQAASLTLTERLATVEVRYHEQTPVYDVGTDGLRNLGMQSLLQLNDLSISQTSGVVIKTQTGYVPPPLVGIWARFPYFHNNSAPSLCAVLTKQSDRPAQYYSGPSDDPKVDFDAKCNGYPLGDAVPAAWLKDTEALYDTTRQGLGNQGHDEGVFLKNGVEMFTADQKSDIIVFLQTL